VQSAVEGIDRARDNHGGKTGVDLLGAANQFVAVHLGHQKVAEDQVECAGKRSLEDLEGLLRSIDCNDAVATGFEKEGADRENLLVVIYAKDRFLGAHAVSLLPDATLWWLAADGPVWRICWFADRRPGGVHNFPVARPDTALRRVMGLLLRGADDKRAKLSCLLLWGPAPSARRAMLPNRGVRERPCANAGCHAAPGGKEPFCCEYSEGRCIETGIGLNACAGSEVALGESRLRGSQASLNSNCRKTGESTFHFERRCTLHAGPSSTLSNSTNGWRAWQWRSYGEDDQY
jgi:hypothetical protein